MGQRAAGAARFPGAQATLLAILLPMLAAGPLYDWLTRRRVHWAYVLGVTLLSTAVAAALAQTYAGSRLRSPSSTEAV
jgi:hypothetical protein